MELKLGFVVTIIGLFLIFFENGVLAITPKEKIMNQSLLWKEMFKNQSSVSPKDEPTSISHWAMYLAPSGEGQMYYGAKATFSVYGVPEVKVTQLSSACIWIINGHGGSERNMIIVGWTVHPYLYKDNRTHLFTLWTRDGFRTYCYDTRCAGFILANKTNMVPGSVIDQISTYGGPQYDITIKVYKDSASGNWWLYYGASGHYNDLNAIGYWPSSLFTSLADSASDMHFGGTVAYLANEQGPPMGSGHYPDEGEGKAATFNRIQGVGKNGNMYDFQDNFNVEQDKRECYRVSEFKNNGFFYGGPGHCIN